MSTPICGLPVALSLKLIVPVRFTPRGGGWVVVWPLAGHYLVLPIPASVLSGTL